MSSIDNAPVDPSYPLLPIMTSLGIFLILMPSYWHFKAGNVGTCLYIVWNVIGNLIYLVNAIVWRNNLMNPSHFWCDLSTKLMIGLSVGMPTASLLINRRLYLIATIRSVQVSRGETRRAKYIELAVGITIPLVVMALHVVVQGHRFDIFEGVGCWPSTYITPMVIPTVYIWPVLLGFGSLIYGVLSIRAFLKQRKQFAAVLQSSNSGLNASRYFRLMALAFTECCFELPFSIYLLVTNLVGFLHPWISWDDTHYDFNRTEYIPFTIFQLNPHSWVMINVTRYCVPVGSYMFFAYLGLSGESGVFYRKLFWRAAGLLGFQHHTTSPGSSWIGRSVGTAPSSHMRSLPPFATTVSAASLSTTNKKEKDALDMYGLPSGGRPKSQTSSDFDDEELGEKPGDDESESSIQSEPPHYQSSSSSPPSEVSKDVV